MKNKIAKIILLGFALTSSYLLGTTQSKTVTKEIIPDNYIVVEDCIPLSDIAGYYIDKYDYICFELKDVTKQNDDPNGESYKDIISKTELPHLTDLEENK
jgi:hypothetical protein